jgi:hypothetical protein
MGVHTTLVTQYMAVEQVVHKVVYPVANLYTVAVAAELVRLTPEQVASLCMVEAGGTAVIIPQHKLEQFLAVAVAARISVRKETEQPAGSR